jgi:hypothetical protein
MKQLLKRNVSIVSSLWLILSGLIGYPSKAYAIAVGNMPECKEIPNSFWTPRLAKNYARAYMDLMYNWNSSEFIALNKLWTAESNWRHNAFNKSADRNTGKHAGGIPQILGLDPKAPAPLQIERGLAYIEHRYKRPSIAWAHHRKHGWY